MFSETTPVRYQGDFASQVQYVLERFTDIIGWDISTFNIMSSPADNRFQLLEKIGDVESTAAIIHVLTLAPYSLDNEATITNISNKLKSTEAFAEMMRLMAFDKVFTDYNDEVLEDIFEVFCACISNVSRDALSKFIYKFYQTFKPIIDFRPQFSAQWKTYEKVARATKTEIIDAGGKTGTIKYTYADPYKTQFVFNIDPTKRAKTNHLNADRAFFENMDKYKYADFQINCIFRDNFLLGSTDSIRIQNRKLLVKLVATTSYTITNRGRGGYYIIDNKSENHSIKHVSTTEELIELAETLCPKSNETIELTKFGIGTLPNSIYEYLIARNVSVADPLVWTIQRKHHNEDIIIGLGRRNALYWWIPKYKCVFDSATDYDNVDKTVIPNYFECKIYYNPAYGSLCAPIRRIIDMCAKSTYGPSTLLDTNSAITLYA